jgi:hypothetical protein
MGYKAWRLLISALVGVAVLTVGSSAFAAYARSRFDPTAFFGDGFFQVSDGCLSLNGSYKATSGVVAIQTSCSVGLARAEFDVIDGLDFAHVIYNPVAPDFDPIFNVVFEAGRLVGVDSDLFGPMSSNTCGGNLCDYAWFLEWESGQFDPVYLSQICTAGDGSCTPDQFDPRVFTADIVTFTNVPEPATLGLILGALGAGWMARRRKIAV